MKTLLARQSAGWLILQVVVLCGCNGSDGGKGRLAPVTGRVTFKGEAVTAASIYFHPDSSKGNEGPLGASVLETDGSFTIATQGIGTGVRPGAYKVSFDLGRRQEKELKKFRSVKTTTLVYDVPEDGLTDLEIALDKEEAKPQSKESKN